MRTYKARGIVLHTIKYGDSSAIAYLFTDVLGRMSYMVQGIRSKRGRGNKAALLQPMFLVEFEGVEQPHAQMHRIREMRSLRPLMSVPFDVRKSTISMFMAEVLYRLMARRGQFPFREDLGSRLWQLGQLSPAKREAAAAQYVAEALSDEPQLRVQDTALTWGTSGAELTVTLSYAGTALTVTAQVR